VAKLLAVVQEHGNEFVIAGFEQRIGVDVEHFEVDGKSASKALSASSISWQRWQYDAKPASAGSFRSFVRRFSVNPLMVTKVCISPRRTSRVTLAVLSNCASKLVELFSALDFGALAARNQRQDDVAWPQVGAHRVAAHILDEQTAIDLELAFLLCGEFRHHQSEAIGCPFGRLLAPLLLRTATFSSVISPTTTGRSRLLPLRHTWTITRLPGLVLPTMRGKSLELTMALPSNFRMTSPGSMPAFSAGPPFSTALTAAPWALLKPNDSARSLFTS
jgi:hypothetical protein